MIKVVESATREAPNNPTMAASSSTPLSGRTMTTTPIKPAKVARPRRQRTLSPSKKNAVRIMNNGLVKLIAVESVSGSLVVA